MITIVVYHARDGRYGYCPVEVRHWTAFNYKGEFQTEAEAFEAALKDKSIPKNAHIVVEK